MNMPKISFEANKGSHITSYNVTSKAEIQNRLIAEQHGAVQYVAAVCD